MLSLFYRKAGRILGKALSFTLKRRIFAEKTNRDFKRFTGDYAELCSN